MKSDTEMMMIAASAACGSAAKYGVSHSTVTSTNSAQNTPVSAVRPPPVDRDMLPATGMPPVNAAPKSAAPSAISS